VRIIYPGPKVEGEARKGAHYYGALGVLLKVGENEVPEEIGERLVALGQAERPASPEPEKPKRRRATTPASEEE